MARNYGRITTSIWRDPDFRDLAPDGRFVYVMLVTQAEVSAAGVMTIALRRWAGNLGFDVGRLEKALHELEERAYIVVDIDAEELLIRSFVKWDGGANNDKRRQAIKDAAAAVESPSVAASLAHTLDRLNVPHGLVVPHSLVGYPQREGLLDSQSDSHRVVVKKGELSSQPQPLTSTREGPQSAYPIPSPIPPDEVGPPPMYCSKHPDGTDESCGACGTARRRYGAWTDAKLAAEVEARTASAKARRTCALCDEAGLRLDPDTELPLGRCDHLPRSAS